MTLIFYKFTQGALKGLFERNIVTIQCDTPT